MLLQLTTVALVWASGSALPAPGASGQFVFLTPQISKFTLQPTFKFQPDLLQTVVPTTAKINPIVGEKSSVQYEYIYPQYYTLRQDDEGSTPWWMNIQNWFQTISGGESASEGGDGGDASAESGAAAADTKSGLNIIDANKVKLVEKSDRFVYLTPASTSVLNPEKRFFILPEPPKIFGSISGPALNPVFSLQPLLSRSTSSTIGDQIVSAEPAVVVPESNVPKIVPNQPVVPAVEQINFLKSHIADGLKAANEVPENRLAPVNDVQTRAGVEVNDEGAVVQSLPAVSEVLVNREQKGQEPEISSVAIPDSLTAETSNAANTSEIAPDTVKQNEKAQLNV